MSCEVPPVSDQTRNRNNSSAAGQMSHNVAKKWLFFDVQSCDGVKTILRFVILMVVVWESHALQRISHV